VADGMGRIILFVDVGFWLLFVCRVVGHTWPNYLGPSFSRAIHCIPRIRRSRSDALAGGLLIIIVYNLRAFPLQVSRGINNKFEDGP
jgi:hypothetical protein